MANLKEQILQTAAQMFWNIGIRRVGIDDICNELRISKRTFYAVFKTKNELIESILDEHRMANKDKRRFDDNNKGNMIDLLFSKSHLLKTYSKESEKLLHIEYDLKKYYPELFEKHIDEMRQDWQIVVLEMLEKGIAQGVFRDNMDLNLMKQLISDIFSQTMIYFHRKKISWVVIIDFCIDTVIRVVCNEAGMEYYLKKYNKA